MYIFFQCVAEAVAEKGLRGLAEFVPGGGAMYEITEGAWKKYRERCKEAQQREEIQSLAQATFEQVSQAAQEAAKTATAKEPDLLPAVELYLTQIPAVIRQSLKRSDDPTGTTVPANFSLRTPEDVAKLLPPSLPRFKAGDPLPGRTGWVLQKQLGIGGFGEVWLVRKPGYDSLVGAVKFCRNLDRHDRDLLHESKVIDRLLKYGDHAHIVKLLDVHLEGEAPWLLYEYVEGGDLTDLIHQWAALPPSERQHKAIVALKELAATIAHFHQFSPAIVHRDLKPANILCDKAGKLRITDFGISGISARHLLENETRGGQTRAGRLQSCLCGSYTPLYASPQQRNGADPDPRDDVHALGVLGYQMLTGQLGQGVSSDFAEDLQELGVQKGVIDLLARCTAAKLDRRLADAKAVSDGIDAIFTSKPDSDPRRPDAKASSAATDVIAGEKRHTRGKINPGDTVKNDESGVIPPVVNSAANWMIIAGFVLIGASVLSSFTTLLFTREWNHYSRLSQNRKLVLALHLFSWPAAILFLIGGYSLYRHPLKWGAILGAIWGTLLGPFTLIFLYLMYRDIYPDRFDLRDSWDFFLASGIIYGIVGIVAFLCGVRPLGIILQYYFTPEDQRFPEATPLPWSPDLLAKLSLFTLLSAMITVLCSCVIIQ